MISFPALAGLCILARPFVDVLLGAKWSIVIPLIMIMSPAGIILAMGSTAGVIYLVKGRTNWAFLWAIVSGAFSLLGVVIGLHWGVVGVATAYLVALVLLTYPGFAIPFRLIELSFADFLSALSPYAVGTAIMILSVLSCRFVLERFGVEDVLVLVASVITGCIVYASFILIARPQGLYDFGRLVFLKGALEKAG